MADDAKQSGGRRRAAAFSLVELLVVIGIIAILVGLVLVSLRGVRAAGGRTDSMGALRQIGVAYSAYSQENSGQLLPGYIGESLFASNPFKDIKAILPDGTVLADRDRQSYVWRLAPYVDNAWQTFFADRTERGPLSQFEADYDQGIYGPAAAGSPNHAYAGNLSERPTYGLNAIFVGGDSVHGGGQVTALNPWTGSGGKIAATRLSEVRSPSRLIIFAPAALAATGGSSGAYNQPEVGFCELRPPYLILDGPSQFWQMPQWKINTAGSMQTTASGQYAQGAGIPIDRRGNQGKMALVNLDGSSGIEEIAALTRDMRRWSPNELAMRPSAPPD